MFKRQTILLSLWLLAAVEVFGQDLTIGGRVIDSESRKPMEFASVLLQESGLWAITDAKGQFQIRQVGAGEVTLVVQCLGYVKHTQTLRLANSVDSLEIAMHEENLKLEEVVVVARRKSDDLTTSYTIDRTTLDNQQLLNLSDIATLLPGGKTVNGTLMSDDRLALRSESQEKGNASFGTAVEVDGQRMDNNATMGETLAPSTRNMSSSDIESVEIVTGIPSVEYGDLSNGIVKVNTRRGKSPFVVEGKLNQHTRQIALNKGFDLGRKNGLLNISLEHARSFSNVASPYTAYQRNILSVRYSNTFMRRTTPLTLNVGVTGNVGGYNSDTDPDETLESYTKERDNLLRGNVELRLLLNKKWVTNLSLKGSFSLQDKRAEYYSNASSASTQPYIHSREEGYFIAQDYETAPDANIILGPTGYWYVRSWNDQKPQNFFLQLKYDWSRRFGKVVNRLMVGEEYKASGNEGRGTHYENMRYAPTWREYRYDELPWMHNVALFAENKLTVRTGGSASLQMTAGVRDDITLISGSDYGNISSFSPRFNARYVFWREKEQWVRSLSVHAGWGKSVKLPSFQVLYPSPSYSDVLAFTPGSTWDNRAYYAYYTYVANPVYNPDLKWQYTNQTDVGIEANIGGTKISVSAFYHKTFNPYTAIVQYSPYTYKMTSQQAIEGSGVASADRRYTVDQTTGIVTLHDASGTIAPQELAYSERLAYNSTRKYINASPIERYGLEWVVDFAQIRAIRTSLRIDGNFYSYKGIDETVFPANTSGVGTPDAPRYPLIGYYCGSSSTSTGTTASATVANGRETRQVNLNATLTTHIPKVRLIVALRLESSLFSYSRSLTESKNGKRGVVLENINDFFGEDYDKSVRNHYVAVYPEYYSTWDDPTTLIPFLEKFVWAKDNDRTLYNQLSRLVVKTNYPYILNPDYVSKYFSANFTVTKEIGDHVSISFYANNFFNNMGHVHSSQTDLKSSLFGSGYIPKFYYGLSLRLKI